MDLELRQKKKLFRKDLRKISRKKTVVAFFLRLDLNQNTPSGGFETLF